MPVLLRLLAVWLAVIAIIHLINRVPIGQSWLLDLVGGLTPVVLVYAAVIAGWRARLSMSWWRIDGGILQRELLWFAVVAGVIFPSAFVGNHLYQMIFFGGAYSPAALPHVGAYAWSQLFLVAAPEEFFFRGWLQQNLTTLYPPRRSVFGAPFGMAQILTAVLFAVSHSLITVEWWHVFIFFPALVFGWLKEKTGTIWSASLFHAACNVFAYWVAGSYSSRIVLTG